MVLINNKHYKFFWVVFFYLFLACVQTGAAKESVPPLPIFNNLTIIVPSCDKYAEVWQPFFTFLFKSWPSLLTHNAHVPIILITNKKIYPDARVITSEEVRVDNWSNSLIGALHEVKTEYVLYLQEDYIIRNPVNEQRLLEILTAMDKEGTAYVEIGGHNHEALKNFQMTRLPGVVKAAYRIPLQASLWRKDVLEWLLKGDDKRNEFEKESFMRSQGMMKPFWITMDDFPIDYLDACSKGYWRQDVLDYIKSQGVDVTVKQLPVDKDHSFLRWLQEKSPKYYDRVMLIRSWF
jgi:hypothetical protein